MSEVPEFRSLVDMHEWAVARFADKPAFGNKVDGRYEWVTHGEFGDHVRHFRAALAEMGLAPGEKVAIISSNRVEWAVACYATYSLGAHFVPMYEAQLAKEWGYILNDSDAVILLTSTVEIHDRTRPLVAELPKLRASVCFDAPADADHAYKRWLSWGSEHPREVTLPAPDDTAGLIYTSGTTGNPKGVILSHANLVKNVMAFKAVSPTVEATEVTCSFLPWAHSFGQVVELHSMLSGGNALGLAESVNTLLDDFALVRPTVLFAVPRVFNKIYDGLQKRMAGEKPTRRFIFNKAMDVARRRRELRLEGSRSAWLDLQHGVFDKLVFAKIRDRFGGRLKYAVSGGAALQREVAEFIDDVGIVVCEGYGLTETSPIATANTPTVRRFGSVGKPVPGVEIYICDEQQRVVPQGQEGEIVIVGHNVMQGYHKLPVVTDEVIFDLDGKRAFRSGDMGLIDADGFVKITGRFKEQYKLENGKYVVPTPLEEHLRLSGMITQCFIYGDNRPYNVLLVVPDFEAVKAWGSANGLSLRSDDEVADSDAVHKMIGEEIERFAGAFKGYERPRRWAILAEEFTTENDLLTPKMSVKRRNVVKRYQDALDRLYD